MKRKQYDLELRPVHYACVSGGKDSLFMLNLILHNLDKYPLDCVVHYQLEIDWKWTNNVVDYMEKECKKYNIRFIRIKPNKTWDELYKKYDFPTRRVRWCNSEYKLDAEKQMIKWIESMNCRPVAYIGLCADEQKRFKYDIGKWQEESICYPLAEENITEATILEWAKKVPLFEDWYKYFNRQGCMMCPMLTRKEIAYMCKYENEQYNKYFDYIKAYEDKYKTFFWEKPCEEIKHTIETKWLSILEMEENQITLFDLIT